VPTYFILFSPLHPNSFATLCTSTTHSDRRPRMLELSPARTSSVSSTNPLLLPSLTDSTKRSLATEMSYLRSWRRNFQCGIFEVKATAGDTCLCRSSSASTRKVHILFITIVLMFYLLFCQISLLTPMPSIISTLLASVLSIPLFCHPNLH